MDGEGDDSSLGRRVRHGLHRVLVVLGVLEIAGPADAGCDVDDHRVRGAAQERQRGLCHPHDAGDVRVQHGRHGVRVEVIDAVRGAEDAGVVYEDVQFGQLGERRVDRLLISHVQSNHLRAEGACGVAGFGVTHARVDGVASLDETAGGFQTEAAVATGDQCRCHASTLRREALAWVCPAGTRSDAARRGIL